MLAKEKIKKYLTAVNDSKRTGEKNNLLSIQLLENFENDESIVVACFDVSENNDITYEAERSYKNGVNHGYWVCENVLSTSSGITWHELQKDWSNQGFKQTMFINF